MFILHHVSTVIHTLCPPRSIPGVLPVTVDVGTGGPDATALPAIAFVFDQAVDPVVTAPAGWACGPADTATTTTVTCTIDTLAGGATQSFSLAVTATAAQAGKIGRAHV